jgi:uncharacterized RDD family membrane protein YckC
MQDMTPNAPGGYQVAPTGTRFVAFLIDLVIAIAIAIPFSIVGLILGSPLDSLLSLVSTAISIYVFAWGMGVSGFTPGKRSQGAMLLSESTNRPVGGGMGIARYILASILTAFCLADVIALLATGRRITDRILGTNVYHVQPGEIMPIFPNGKPF